MHPVTAGFFYTISIMHYTNSNNISAKSLKNALECIDNLTEAAAEVAAIFHTYQAVIENGGLPADPQVVEECSQMFVSMNRMLLRQKADLQHIGMMQKSMAKAEKIINGTGRESKKSNQAVAVA